MTSESRKATLEKVFLVGVEACRAGRVLPQYLPTNPPKGRTIVLGAGKAAAEMASVVAQQIEGDLTGCVVTRYHHATDDIVGDIEIIEAGHPVPDENSVAAADRILELAQAAEKDDRVIFLISGGGSALLVKPIAGISLSEKREVTQALLTAGAPVSEINFVRKHLSAVKGGGLAAVAAPAEQYSFIISDVVGDRAADVASGPTQPMKFAPGDAIAAMKKYGIDASERMAGALYASPRSDIPLHHTEVVARNKDAIAAITKALTEQGWFVECLGTDVEGEAFDIGRAHADYISTLKVRHRPRAFVSGGELTVTVSDQGGRGGPNLEYLCGLTMGMGEGVHYAALAGDSDGIDGTETNAGGYVDETTLARFKATGLDFQDFIRRNQSYGIFEKLGDLVETGPTRTNVNDIRIILVDDDAVAA